MESGIYSEFKDNISDFAAFGFTTGIALIWKDIFVDAVKYLSEGSLLALVIFATLITLGFTYVLRKYPNLYVPRSR